jgi:hypothetical protein
VVKNQLQSLSWSGTQTAHAFLYEAVSTVYDWYRSLLRSLSLYFPPTEAAPNLLFIFVFLPYPASAGPESIRLQDVLWLSDPIKQAKWNPSRTQCLATVTLPSERGRLALGSGVYIWEGDWDEEKHELSDTSLKSGGSAVMVAMSISKCSQQAIKLNNVTDPLGLYPGEFETHDIRWSPDGENLCILDKTQFCLLQEPAAPATEKHMASDLSVIKE